MEKRTRYERINELVDSIKNGDSTAVKELLGMFLPLIHKTCGSLYRRYNGLIPIDDLIYNGKHLFVYLVCMEYDPLGGAHFPQFIRTHLHARLTQYCRPIVDYRKRVTELDDRIVDKQQGPRDKLYKAERENIIRRINNFMWATFNDRELDIVINHMIKGVSRNKLRIEYGISKIRMRVIYRRCQEKLRNFLKKIGIRSMKDI